MNTEPWSSLVLYYLKKWKDSRINIAFIFYIIINKWIKELSNFVNLSKSKDKCK